MRMKLAIVIASLALMTLHAAHAAPAEATGQVAAALETLRERYAQHLVRTIDSAAAGEYLASQRQDGSWADVDYADRSRVDWSPDTHLQRLQAMAAAYRTPGGKHHNSAPMLEGVRRGLELWDRESPRGHIWRNNLGMPIMLAPTLLLTRDQLDKDLRNRIVTGHMSNWLNADSGKHRSDGGADFVRGSALRIVVGLIVDDAEAVKTGSSGIQGAARLAEQGLQPDGSYHYHGPQIYFPAYSWLHFDLTALWAGLLKGTPWEYDAEATAFLREGALNGFRWVFRHQTYDPLVRGRMIARKLDAPVSIAAPRVNLKWVESLLLADPQNAEHYQAMLDHVAGRRPAAVVGNRHFWTSDYMAHHRDGFMLSVRMMSTRTSLQEQGNGENIRNRWLTQGATSILVHGDEYQDVFPLWDWRRIPGVTATNQGGPRGGQSAGMWGMTGFTEFVGGASDGMHGVAAMDMDWHDGSPNRGPERQRQPRVTAYKNWFFFDREMVALGSGIQYPGDLGPLQTTVNQTLRKSQVFSSRHPSGQGEPDTSGDRVANLAWLWHYDVGYLFPERQTVVLKNESGKTGQWRSINEGYDASYSETGDVLTLGIDHGDKPTDATYAYIVVPGQTREQFETYRKSPQVQIIVNTPHVAAVHHVGQKLSGVVLRDPQAAGDVRIHERLSVTTDAPAIVLIDESVSPVQVTVGAPTEQEVTITLTTPAGRQVLTFPVPGTRSVTKPLN
jgi:chondroitin AC lyase